MKIRHLDLSNTPVNQEHAQLGLPPTEVTSKHPVIQMAAGVALVALVTLLGLAVAELFSHSWEQGLAHIQTTLHSSAFWNAVLVGLLAQAIDGALGMAYGLTSTSFLLATGASPALASASVHMAEVFTTGLSGISHAKLGNVDKHLFLRLLVPGILGGVLGALIVTQVDASVIKPFITVYLFIMGLYVLRKAFLHRQLAQASGAPKHVAKLALLGGFLDTSGGGGWGPVVTTTLVGSGHNPRTTIGSVNFAEFFLTLTSAGALFVLVDETIWTLVAGLILGGLFAAPFAALACKKLSTRSLLILVGTLISGISLFNLYKALF